MNSHVNGESITCQRAQCRLSYEVMSRTTVASVGSVFNDTRKVKVLSLPETIKKNSTIRAKALRRELVVGPSLETSIFPLSFRQ